jgi:transcriptional regulator with XRE-family HTH domain
VSAYERQRVALAFGATLRSARRARGISQDGLGALCALDRTYPSLLERGKRHPTLHMILRLSQGLRVEPEWLVTETKRRLRMSGAS